MSLNMPEIGNVEQVIQNFALVSHILSAVGVVMGLMLFLSGVHKFKILGEGRNMMSGQHNVFQPFLVMLAGGMLMGLPFWIPVINQMFFGTPTLMDYVPVSSDGSDYYEVMVVFLRVLGLGSLMNGIVKLSRVGAQQAQPGMMGRAFIFIIGGIMCLNCVATYNLVFSFFGT